MITTQVLLISVLRCSYAAEPTGPARTNLPGNQHILHTPHATDDAIPIFMLYTHSLYHFQHNNLKKDAN